MTSYTIKDLETISGIKAHTIRIWEQRYHFLQPKRTETNIRTYSGEELKTILNVSLLNKYGFKISHIDKMSTNQIEEKILSLNQLEAQRERLVNGLIKEMVSLNMVGFEKLLDLNIAQKGIDKTITEVIFNFLERVGILWVTNHINPAQEHLATNIMRQKIILGIEKLPSLIQYTKRVVLFMPEGEHHEIGLLYVHFLLKQRGIYVDYLGANVPTVDLKYLTEVKKVDYLYCHLTSPAKNFKVNKFFEQLGEINNQIPIILSGQLIQMYKGVLAPNIQLKKSLAETLEFLKTL
ncbi:MAG: MerR family transcriptional regulator [Chitinophagia bacterium]|jgi:DNA-binding transcriptional MerR regulator|nr:MerR family transcriptional regulator [Chitinophagia bacterium]